MATQQSNPRPAAPQTPSSSFPSSPLQGPALTERAIALVAQHPEYAPALAALLGIGVAPAGAPVTSASSPDAGPAPASAAASPGTPMVTTVPGLLQSPAAGLFRPGYCDSNGISELPFVQQPGTGEDYTLPGCNIPLKLRSFWQEPDFGEGDGAYDRAEAFGKRSAAAWFLSLQAGDTRISLHELLEDMFAESESRSGARTAFCSYLTRLLWLHGQHLSPAQIAADVEAILRQDAERAAEDKAYLQEVR